MNKIEFYTELKTKLSDLGVPDVYISRHLKQFDSYFSDKTDSEISAEISKLGNLDRVALRIKNMTDKISDNDKNNQIKQSSNDENANRNDENIIRNNRNIDISEKSMSDKSLEDEDVYSSPDEIYKIRKISSDPMQKPSIRQQAKEVASKAPVNPTEAEPDNTPHKDAETEDYVYSDEPISEHVTDTTIDEETLRKNTKKFWIIFSVCLPLTVAVVTAIVFAFGFVFFAIAMAIILSVALLVAIVAAGTMISVFGMIFGIVQAISSLPIGLYECGISIIIGSLTMFFGILIYNFAVRLMPFAAKWLLRFAKFVTKKLKELFLYTKKECIGL